MLTPEYQTETLEAPLALPVPSLLTESLSVRFGRSQVLHGIDSAFPRGQITAIIGPTGCGKSTLLRCLNRLNDTRPNFRMEGRVLFQGRDIYRVGMDVREHRRRVGMLFQRPNPFPQSIKENVALGARMHHLWRRREVAERTEATLRWVGIWDAVQHRLGASPFDLSGGQQQLLCLARALAVEPEVLLLDEPTSSLDPKSTGGIEELLSELKERVTIVLVTHDLRQAARLADQVLFLLEGEVVESSVARRFFNAPQDERSRAYLEGVTD